MRFNGKPTTDTGALAALVAADGTTGGFLKDSDFEQGTWTPTFAVSTPGDFAQTLSTQVGVYTKIRKLVIIECALVWSSFTHTTASGTYTVTGLPYNARTTPTGWWTSSACSFGGFTNANYTTLAAYLANTANTAVNFQWSGQGQALVGSSIAQIPSGGTVRLRFSLAYETD